jgi:restriction system protein
MSDPGPTNWLGRQFDDYVEEMVVGHRAWIIVLLFALTMAIATGLVDFVVPSLYRPGSVGIGLFIGALIGLSLVLVARERSRYRAAAIDHTGDIAALRKKPWGEFEVLVGQVFRNQGYVVKERGGFKRDYGVDLIAERGKERVLIQCKHWTQWNVGEGPVKELYADTKAQEFTAGWLVTCGRFSENAKSWASGKEIRLIDGEALVQLLPSRPLVGSPAAAPRTPVTVAAPSCPNCGSPLHRMTNSYDESKFWSCFNPKCRWTLDDVTQHAGAPKCSHGHAMAVRVTAAGIEYWGCTDPTCSRKRLLGPPTRSS